MTDIRSNSLAKYPGLWRGCVFAAAPCLGPTGTVLRTFTPTHNQALLTNMDPATDWVVSGGRYALDFDGSNDHVNVASPVGVTSTGRQCISFWFRCSGAVVPGNYPCVFSLGIAGIPYTSQLNCGFNQFATGVSGGTGRLTTLSYDGVSLASGCYSNTNFVGTSSWYHVVTGWDGVAWKIFVNGVDETNAQNSQVAPAAITAPRMVWGGHASLNRPAVVQLDDMRMYHRFLAASEIRLLASRRGISYEQRRRGVFFPASAGVYLAPGAGAGSGAGHAPSVMAGVEPVAGVGAGSGAGQSPAVSHGHVLSAGTGAGTGSGHAPSLSVGGAVSLTVGAGSGSCTGYAPSVVNGHALTAGVGSGTGVGYSTAPEIGAFISIGSGAGTGTGYSPTVSTSGAVLALSRRKLFLSGGLFV